MEKKKGSSDPQEPSDDEIKRGLLDGERWAIDWVLNLIGPVIRSKLYDPEDRLDAEQDTHRRLFMALPKSEIRNMRKYARKLARCSVVDIIRQKHLDKMMRIGWIDLEAFDAFLTSHSEKDGRTHDQPGDRELVVYVLQRLAVSCREIFISLFCYDRSYEQVAKEFGVTCGALRTQLSRCRKAGRKIRKQALSFC